MKVQLEEKLRELYKNNCGDDIENNKKIREILAELVKIDTVYFCKDYFRVTMWLLRGGAVRKSEAESAREYCRRALRECNDESRPYLLSNIVCHEDEDKLDQWKSFITSDIYLATWDDILRTRYFAVRKENHRWEAQMKKVVYEHIHAAVWIMANDKAGECQRIASWACGPLHDEAHYRKILSLIDLFYDDEDDLFLSELIFVKIRLMAVLVESGRTDEGAELIPELREHLGALLKRYPERGGDMATADLKYMEMRSEFDSVRDDSRFREFFTFLNSLRNSTCRSVVIPDDERDEAFDLTDWLPLLETARKISDEERDQCDFTKIPTVIVLKATSGNIYSEIVYNTADGESKEERELLAELREKGDTCIEKMIFMHIDIGAVDMFRFAGEIAKLDKRNQSTELLLPGENQYIKRNLREVYGKKYFE